MSTRIASYDMSPAEDVLLYGDEIAEGMLVLTEASFLRPGSEAGEDGALRGQRFCKVTKLRRHGDIITFIGEYVDGFQKSFEVAYSWAWIVKRDSVPPADETPDGAS